MPRLGGFWGVTNSIAKELQTSVAHSNNAKKIWVDFEERFTQGIAPRVYELKMTIALLQQEKSSISIYYGKLKNVWGELQNLRAIPTCTCGAGKKMQEMQEEEKVFDFLMGLDETYKTVRSQILSVEPLSSLGRACAVVAQDEKQHNITMTKMPMVEATTLLAKESMERRERAGKIFCTKCGRKNHTHEKYYEIIGYPPNWRKPRLKDQPQQHSHSSQAHYATSSEDNANNTLAISQVQKLLSLLNKQPTQITEYPSANMATKDDLGKKISWIIDIGATDHITYDIGCITEKRKPRVSSVQIPNGESIPVYTIGQVELVRNL